MTAILSPISSRIARLSRVLSTAGISPSDLDRGTVPTELAASAFVTLLVALFLAPPALVGLATHAPAYSLIQKCAKPMREAGGGAVVNISSTAARYAQKHFSAYGSAKAALNQMTRCLAQDFAPHVRINAIEPGSITEGANSDQRR